MGRKDGMTDMTKGRNNRQNKYLCHYGNLDQGDGGPFGRKEFDTDRST